MRKPPVPDPVVSIILPVRNGGQFLAEAIESVAAQSYRAFELIVVDGGSTDGSVEIARSYDIVRHVRQIGRGLPDAWNQGIAAARGTLLAFNSADDRWTPDKLACQVEWMGARPETAYTIAMFRFFLQHGCAIPRGFNPDLLGRSLVGRIPETLVVRREAFDVVGPFNTEYGGAQDVDWFLRALEAKLPMAVLPDVLLHKRIHDANLSSNAAVNTPALMQMLKHSIQRRRVRRAT